MPIRVIQNINPRKIITEGIITNNGNSNANCGLSFADVLSLSVAKWYLSFNDNNDNDN